MLCHYVCNNIVLRYVSHWTDKQSKQSKEICLDLHGQDIVNNHYYG